MKSIKFASAFLSIPLLFLISCSKQESLVESDKSFYVEQPDISKSTKKASRVGLKTIGSGVMMQAFYWDVPSGGNWWDHLNAKVSDWSNAGIDAIWLPPVSKAQNGAFSMGYDPFDYYDLGEYNQMGSTETRFGARTELESLISNAHTNGLNVIADIVINHNSGGDIESNIFTGGNTYSDFQPLSGMFNRSMYDFHPNDFHSNDTGSFGGFSDMCHHKTYVQNWLWNNENSVAKYYMNEIGFDGRRIDYVKGFEPWVVKNRKNAVGGFSFGEYWDGNASTLE
jgi:alpha-amylase